MIFYFQLDKPESLKEKGAPLAHAMIYHKNTNINPLNVTIVVVSLRFPARSITDDRIYTIDRFTKKLSSAPVDLQIMSTIEHETLEALCAEILREEGKKNNGMFDNIGRIFSDRWMSMENLTPVVERYLQ